MNHRIEITKINRVWRCQLISFDPLIFGKYPDNLEGTLYAESYAKLIELIEKNELFKLIEKNR